MRLVANLLCEAQWAGARVPPRIARAASDLGAQMAALARPGDSLWTPLPVGTSHVTPGPGLPRVPLESGPLAALPPAPILAWGETEETARARPAACALRPPAASDHWLDVIRALRPPTPQTHRRVCDRRLQLAFAAEAGLALPGARIVASIDELFAAAPLRWVAKAPWSAAGRERLRGRGTDLRAQDRRRLARLLAAYGQLVLEPWCERTADFGAIAFVAAGVVRRIGFHRSEMTGGGAFRSLRPLPETPVAGGLTGDEMAALHDAVRVVGAWLAAEGYEGPLGIDAWRYVDEAGATRFHALGELNARLTLGFLARRRAEASGSSRFSRWRRPWRCRDR